MAADKFLKLNAQGRTQEGVPVTTPSATQTDDAGRLVGLMPDGRLNPALMPSGIGADTESILCAEAVPAGSYVNVFIDASNANARSVRKAIADTVGKEADGFVLDSFASGETALVYFEGRNTAMSGLTAGERYYLSSTAAGQATLTAPVDAGNVVQYLGRAISTTSVAFEASEGIVRA